MLYTIVFLITLFCSLHADAFKLAVVFPDRKYKLRGQKDRQSSEGRACPDPVKGSALFPHRHRVRFPGPQSATWGCVVAHYKAAFNTKLETKSKKKGNK